MLYNVALGATILAGTASAAGVTFSGMTGVGKYQNVASLSKTGECVMGDWTQYTRKTSPLDEELSVAFRGPIAFQEFAVYNLDTSPKVKREHLNKHKRRGHQQFHEANKVKREPVEVTAVIDGKTVHFQDTWNTPAPAAPAAAAPAVKVAQAAAPAPEAAPTYSAGSGNFARTAYYNAKSSTAQGVTFLANNNWANYAGLGAVLGHVASNGKDFTTDACTLADTVLPDNTEVIISSNTPCVAGDSCGVTAPDAAAYHGFDGSNKLMLFKFTMPDSGKVSTDIYSNDNKPAIWLLNSKIVNTQQYAGCSPWKSGGGEFDVHEVLSSGNNTGYATVHMGDNYSGMAPFPIDRPIDNAMKLAVVITDDVAHVEILDDSVSFGPIIDGKTVDGWLNSDVADGATSALNVNFKVILGAVPQATQFTG